MPSKISKKIDPFGRCHQFGLSLWQCPQFLFLLMGFVIISSDIILYLIGNYYFIDPGMVIIIILSVTIFLFIIAYTIVNGFENLAEVSKLKSNFINIVSHQLRSPLTNIKWTFEILTLNNFKVSKEKAKEYSNNIQENLNRMAELINNLLFVSKVEQGKFPMAKKEISLKKIVEDLISRFKVFTESSKIKIDFHCPDDFPNIFADPSLIKLVVENLLDNASHYVKKNGRIEINLKRKRDQVYFSIRDNGMGIPKDEQKYIFQKFFRAENAFEKKTQGSGLGLYVCKSLIDKFGGKIWFDSEEGKGTTFYFTLPIG